MKKDCRSGRKRSFAAKSDDEDGDTYASYMGKFNAQYDDAENDMDMLSDYFGGRMAKTERTCGDGTLLDGL